MIPFIELLSANTCNATGVIQSTGAALPRFREQQKKKKNPPEIGIFRSKTQKKMVFSLGPPSGSSCVRSSVGRVKVGFLPRSNESTITHSRPQEGNGEKAHGKHFGATRQKCV